MHSGLRHISRRQDRKRCHNFITLKLTRWESEPVCLQLRNCLHSHFVKDYNQNTTIIMNVRNENVTLTPIQHKVIWANFSQTNLFLFKVTGIYQEIMYLLVIL